MLFPWNKKPTDIMADDNKTENIKNEPVTLVNALEVFAEACDIADCMFELVDANGDEVSDASKAIGVDFTFEEWIFNVRPLERVPNAFLIIMQGIYSTPIENVNEMRFVCTMLNHEMNYATIYSEPYGDNSKLITTGWTTIDFADAEVIAEKIPQIYELFVSTRKAIVERMGSILKRRGEQTPYDFESDILHSIRRTVLVREAELMHASENSRQKDEKGRVKPTAELTVADLLESMAGINADAIRNACFMNEAGVTPLKGSAASGFQLFGSICKADDGGSLQQVSNWAIVRVELTSNADPVSPKVATVSLSNIGRDMNSVYVKVIITAEGNDPLASGNVVSQLSQPIATKSVFRLTSGKANDSEYRYMLDDARDKVASGRQDELTEDQKLLVRAFISDTGFALYHGSRHFHAGRFAQALPMLLEVFNDMKHRVENMDEAAKESLLQVCFMIGYCYAEMKRYDRAYYYLYMTANQGNLNYDMEFFNCLVNSRDPRAESIIDSALSEFSEYVKKKNENEPDEELPDAVVSMLNFLRRRKAYLLIEHRKFDLAEQLLGEMINEEANHSFAIDELAYIKRKRTE